MVRQTTPLPCGCTNLSVHAPNVDLTCAHVPVSLNLTQPVHEPPRYVKMHNASKFHCRLHFFTYRNLLKNEISHNFSSKSLVDLLIHSKAHIHYNRSLKNWMNFGAWNRVPVVFKLIFTGNTWDRNLWPVSYQIHFKLIYTFRHYFDSLFSWNNTF